MTQPLAHSKQHNGLLSGLGWYCGTEILVKLSRLVTLMALAAMLDVAQYGHAMLAIAVHEILRLGLRAGAGMQIIQSPDAKLKAFAQNGALLQWLVCVSLCLVQCAVAWGVSLWYDLPELFPLLCAMAGAYLLYPIVSIRAYLLQRSKQMKWFSLANGACILAENLATALFAFAGWGLYALAAGKLCFALLWVACFLRAPVEGFGLGFERRVFRYLCRTSGLLIVTELSKSLRQHADVFVAASLLGQTQFGIYAFAKSAGVGLSQSLCQTFASGLYPYLCEWRRNAGPRLPGKVLLLCCLMSGVFLVQAFSANFYIPLLFDEQWHLSTHITATLCLVAIPTLFAEVYCTMLRADAHYSRESKVRILFAALVIAQLLLFSPSTPLSLAYTLLIGTVTAVLMAGFIERRLTVGRRFPSSLKPEEAI